MSLTVQADATCEHVIEDEDGAYPCGALSRFVVERSDDDPSYSPGESCAEHLPDMIDGTVDGDEEVRAFVTIRWTASCNVCHQPAIRKNGSYEHEEAADAAACAIFRGEL